MISQDESTTLNIYVHYKVSNNIKIINWYCKSICMVIIPMVKFMQISFILRFIWKKFIDFGWFYLFLILHEIYLDCDNIYCGSLCVFWNYYYGRKYYSILDHDRPFIFMHQRTYKIHTYQDTPHMWICTR